MGYLSEQEYNSRMRKIQEKNASIARKQKLKEEKNKHKRKFKWPSTSKLVLLGAVLLCLQILLFAEYVMINLGDTSAMYVLIGIPATLVPTIISYYHKARAENTVGGITYDMAMLQQQSINSVEFADADSEEAEG